MAFAYVLLFPTRILVVGPLSRLYNQTFYEYLPVCFVYYLLFMHTKPSPVGLRVHLHSCYAQLECIMESAYESNAAERHTGTVGAHARNAY